MSTHALHEAETAHLTALLVRGQHRALDVELDEPGIEEDGVSDENDAYAGEVPGSAH